MNKMEANLLNDKRGGRLAAATYGALMTQASTA